MGHGTSSEGVGNVQRIGAKGIYCPGKRASKLDPAQSAVELDRSLWGMEMPNWTVLLKEIASTKADGDNSGADIVRRKYLSKLHDLTKRNVIAYYSGFLSKPKVEGVEINDEDKNGFMLCVHKLDKTKGLDLFLHTPGGDGTATESLIFYLREVFGTTSERWFHR
jgi:ClpP class serine protease